MPISMPAQATRPADQPARKEANVNQQSTHNSTTSLHGERDPEGVNPVGTAATAKTLSNRLGAAKWVLTVDCLAAYGLEVPEDRVMYVVPTRDWALSPSSRKSIQTDCLRRSMTTSFGFGVGLAHQARPK
jgi:hypothetical protein